MGNAAPCCSEKDDGADKKDAVVSHTSAEGSVKLETAAPVLQKPSGDGSVAAGTDDDKPAALRWTVDIYVFSNSELERILF